MNRSVLYKKARVILPRLFIFLCLIVFFIGQQASAMTPGDANCATAGDLGGTCFYEPCSGQSSADGTPASDDAGDQTATCCSSSTSTSPASAPTTPGITVDNSAAQSAAQAASTGGTTVGYALYNSSGQLLANFNDTSENYGGSITKSMLLVAYLNQVGSGTLSSEATSELTNMIENSDNTSADWVYGQLNNPKSQVEAVAAQAGMTGFKYDDQGDSVYYLGQSQVTSGDFAKFFSKIDTMLPAAQKSFALGLLSHLASSDQVGLLQAGLPGTVYSKEGWRPEPGQLTAPARSGSANPFGNEGAPYIVNQAGQFSAGGTTYGVAVTVAGTSDQTSGQDIVQKVVSALVKTGGTSTTTPATGTGTTSCCSSSAGTSVPGDASGAKGTWNSGLQPPYIVEQFAINVLEDLAQKKGLPSTDAVTQQHVLALVTWAFIEGGNLNNSSLYNLYNTGQDDPGFTAGGHTADGLGSYISFDAGVEETARTIDDGNHNGMLSVLLDPNSTAKDFAHAESYTGTSTYPGTVEWAGAAFNDPSAYENVTWAQQLQTVESDYKNYASFEIGPPPFEEQNNVRDPSKLSDINSGGFTSGSASGSSGCSGSSQGDTSVVQEAIKLSWPQAWPTPSPGRASANSNSPAYQAALNQYFPGSPPYGGADCGTFVGTVLRASGADPNYPPSGTWIQMAYVLAHPSLYQVVAYQVKDTSVLQPGDILIINQGTQYDGSGKITKVGDGEGAGGHTLIWLGSAGGGDNNVAEASGGDHSAQLENIGDGIVHDPLGRGYYLAVRLIQ